MRWRVGGKVPINVYENDRPMFQCHTPEDAARVVALLNLGEAFKPTVDLSIDQLILARTLYDSLHKEPAD